MAASPRELVAGATGQGIPGGCEVVPDAEVKCLSHQMKQHGSRAQNLDFLAHVSREAAHQYAADFRVILLVYEV